MPTVLGCIVAAVALLVLWGWFADVPALRAPFPANRALAFLAAGVAFAAHHHRATLRGCAVIIAALATGNGIEMLTGAVATDWTAGVMDTDTHPGRMAPATVVGLLLVALAMWTMTNPGWRAFRVAVRCAGVVLAIGVLAIIGLTTSSLQLFRGVPGFNGVTFPTAVMFTLTGLALLEGAVCLVSRTTKGPPDVGRPAMAR